MPRPAKPAIRKPDLHGFKHFKLLLPVLEKLHGEACRRDKAGNRKLHYDQYAALIRDAAGTQFDPEVALALQRGEGEFRRLAVELADDTGVPATVPKAEHEQRMELLATANRLA